MKETDIITHMLLILVSTMSIVLVFRNSEIQEDLKYQIDSLQEQLNICNGTNETLRQEIDRCYEVTNNQDQFITEVRE